MKDREHGAVILRVQKLVAVPSRRERPRLGLAVADHAGDDERRVVERSAEGVAEAVAELAALVDRARRLGRDVARDAAREGELLEEPLQSVLVLRDGGIELAVRSLQVGVRNQRGPAVSRPGNVDHVEIVLPDDAVQVHVDEVLPRRRAPVPEEPRLQVGEPERGPEKRVVVQVYLPDGEVVRRPPVGVHPVQQVAGEWGRHFLASGSIGVRSVWSMSSIGGASGDDLVPNARAERAPRDDVYAVAIHLRE